MLDGVRAVRDHDALPQALMAHNRRYFPGGVCPPGWVWSAGRLRRLDQVASEGLNGKDGGTWAPESAIAIGGGGLTINGASWSAIGRTSTGRAGTIELPGSVTPTCSPARSRMVVLPLLPSSDFSISDFGDRVEHQSASPFGVFSGAVGGTHFFPLPSLRMHHGATIDRMRLRWRSNVQPTSIVANNTQMPRIRAFRIHKNGNTSASWTPSNSADLFVYPPWVLNTVHAVNDMVHSTTGGAWGGSNGKIYRCVVAGTSGGAEPAWSTTVGANQADNTVTWRVEHGVGSFGYQHNQLPPMPLAGNLDLYHEHGTPRDLLHRVNLNAVVDTDTYFYALRVEDPGSAFECLYHSLIVELAGIANMAEP